MSAYNPPDYYFSGIQFNPAFYDVNSTDLGITLGQANSLYLKKTTSDTATALETFAGGILTNNINAVNSTTGDIDIGASQTGGILNLGTGGSTRTGNINIGSTTTTGKINIQTANTTNSPATDGAINIGTTSASKAIRIGNNSSNGSAVTFGDFQASLSVPQNMVFLSTNLNTTRNIAFGYNQTTGVLHLGSGGNNPQARSGDVNIANQASNSCAINIMNGNTTSGSVNIANGTGITQSTTVNIGSGDTTGAVTIGNPSNTILLNSPTTVKSIKQSITYLTSQTNTLTLANILESNFFASTYSLANPTTVNDIITVNIPTPTASLEGMTLTFRKMRGVLNTGSANWTFVCPTSSIVPTGLTAGATPTTTSFNVLSSITRFVVVGYSGSYYYFIM